MAWEFCHHENSVWGVKCLRTTLAANQINCNPWTRKKRMSISILSLYIYIGLHRGTGKENDGVYTVYTI
jgi:hypothetical protein